ncbi:MAG: aspartyl protease family protein [Myxococcaceae bacterium]
MTLRGTLLCLLWETAALAASPADKHVTPFELRRAMPFVQVLVDGKGPFTFGIDTGTGTQALVSPALAETLGLAKTGEVEAGDPSGRGSRKLPLVKVGRLSVAGVEFRDVTAAVYEPSQAEGRCDGILGFVLFRDWLLTLDYRGGQLILARGRLAASPDGTVVPFRAPNDVPIIDLAIGGQTVPAIVDTRGSGLAVPASREGELKLAGEPVVVGRGRTISGEFEIRGAQLAEDVRIGAYRIQTPFVVFHPSFPVGNVGGLVLRQLAVTFDQRSGLLRIDAPDRTLVLPRPQPRASPADAGVTRPAAPGLPGGN